MRTREKIKEAFESKCELWKHMVPEGGMLGLQLEVLLDIRDLLSKRPSE